ncbi:GntR family transcriptional regulator [Streptomyces sp. NPDC050564]|uniref:GntR family transcriptional regulator n=1 Tax=Streptomyces sp. NPDC050564 TaxID=3365631 RepID=UPI00379AB2E5
MSIPGARVPSGVELPAEFGSAASTAQKALAHLEAEGLNRAEVGLGPFVAERPSEPSEQGWAQARVQTPA